MISFRNDYSEGAHPKILAALEQNNLTTTCGYSMDPFCDEARAAIRARFACPAADVHFLVGGTIGQHDRHRRGAAAVGGRDRRGHRPHQRS